MQIIFVQDAFLLGLPAPEVLNLPQLLGTPPDLSKPQGVLHYAT